MNKELLDTLNEGLKLVLDGLKVGVDFAKQEIPLLLKEKLAFDFWMSVVGIVGATILLAVFLFCLYRGIKKSTERNREPAEFIIGIIGTVVSSVLWIVSICINVPIIIQIEVAPRLYLMEWLVSTVK